MYKVKWKSVQKFLPASLRLNELRFDARRNEVALLKTGAKLYGRKRGAVVELWVSGYAPNDSDVPEELRK